MDDKIDLLISGRYLDPETGRPALVATKSVAIRSSLEGTERSLVDDLGFGRKLAVVSDETTHNVLGARVETALRGRYDVISVVLPAAPHPDEQTVEAVRQLTQAADAIIAVGSGSINDISKYASAQDGKPYAVFATAPSMNGYTSLSAAITMHGHKLSLAAQAPMGAFFDLAVLSAAPKRLIRAGLGDSICRTTAQADWLLAHHLFDLPYRELPFDLLKDDEPELLANAAALLGGDLGVMERLVRTLVLSGFGTAIVGNSQPASQGEHLVSHYIDMLSAPDRPLVYHGEQVGVTTLSMVRLQERMLERAPVFQADTETEQNLIDRFGSELGASCWAEFQHKRLDQQRADELNQRVSSMWEEISERIAGILLPASRVRSVLEAAQSPLTPESLHLDRAFYEGALQHSREIRNRYTFLDLAANSGRLSNLIPAL